MSNTILGEHWQSIYMHTTTVTCVLVYKDALCFHEWEVYEIFEHTKVLMHIFFKRKQRQSLNFSLIILPFLSKPKTPSFDMSFGGVRMWVFTSLGWISPFEKMATAQDWPYTHLFYVLHFSVPP